MACKSQTIIDGTSKKTSEILNEINFLCNNNNEADNNNNNNNNDTKELIIRYMTLDRSIAAALLTLIRCGCNNARSCCCCSDDSNNNNNNNSTCTCTRWESIRFYSCRGGHADLVVVTALYLTKSTLEIGKCNFPNNNTFMTLGMECRFSKTQHLAITEQILDERAAIALGEGLSKNNYLHTLNLRATRLECPCLRPIADGLRDARNLRILNLRFCKLRDTHLAVLLHALHPNIQTLFLRGNFCRDQGILEIISLLKHPQCQLQTLDISRQYHVGQKLFSICNLASALSQNQSLKYLDLMSNSLSDRDVATLAEEIMNNSVLEHLILAGSNAFGVNGSKKLLQLVKKNMILERLLIPVRYPKDVMIQELIAFYTNWNKSGRRIIFSRNKDAINVNLWPSILERINKLDWNKNIGTKRSIHHKKAMGASLIYVMLRSSPVLLES